ncbi:HEPN domain-containing protein [Qipengyuania aquimaris]|uniref:HEPN domain-containing protein n=1 Tax=Qipengyuania aquimaris TaxID=255984 RepID=UPI001FD176C3|nr:HEPN domain-containing protein [Qipengyuania aquimaris]UOR16482.1 HEPN domain-containing protein [Qipengyuania aquimaris]
MTVSYKPKWQKSGNLSRLLRELNEGTELNENGGITFTASDHQDLFFLLADSVTSKSDLTRRDLSGISYRSFIELRKQGEVKLKPLLAEISRRSNELLSSERIQHTMWSHMRLKQMAFHPGCRFEFDGVRIRTVARLPKWLRLSEYFISGIGRINPNELSFFGYVIATTDARNENEASEKIFAALDVFFAVANTRNRSLEMWVQRRPTAKFWLGPYQFFFAKRKFLGNDRLWSNPSFDKREWELFPTDARKFNENAPGVRRALSKLQIHPLRKPLEEAFRFVSEGMVSADLAFRLMRFWSAAESLYSIRNQKTSMSVIIDRMVFADGDEKWLTKSKLQRAYEIRNEYVHRGSSAGDDSPLVQHLREVILSFLYYILFNGDDIESHEELLMMLDLPKDVEALTRRATAIERRRLIQDTGRHRA